VTVSTPRFPFVHVVTTEEHADALSSALFDLGATGVEERDQSTYVKGPGDGRVLLVASFDDHAGAESAIAELLDLEEGLVESATLEEIVGDAWRDEWKKYYEPFALTDVIVVRPPWADYAAREGEKVLVLEPGRAFGTGLHATTSLVAKALDRHAARLDGVTVLDVGCGSGILSFVALMLGAKAAVALDNDAEVIDTVRENAERNGLSARLEVFAGVVEDVEATFPWVLANIESRILDPIAESLAKRLAPGGYLVLSGILLAEEQAMVDRFTNLSRKLAVVEITRTETGGDRAYDRDGWVSIVLTDVVS
jgi:ribosomal protein L11 methyltransferase